MTTYFKSAIFVILCLLVSYNYADSCGCDERCVDLSGEIELNFTNYEGNSDTRNVDLEGKIKRTVCCGDQTLHETEIDGEYEFVNREPVNTSKGELNISHKQYLLQRFYIRGAQQFQRDREANIRYFSESLATLGYDILKNCTFELYGEIGAAYGVKNYIDKIRDEEGTVTAPRPLTDHDAYVHFGEGFKWYITDKWTLNQEFQFLPAMKNFGDFDIESEQKLRYKFDCHWCITLSHELLHRSQPSDGSKNSDQKWKLRLGYTF